MLVVCMFSSVAIAQVDRNNTDTTMEKEKRQKGNKHSKSEKMQQLKKLGLSKEQMAQMKILNQETKAKMQALKIQENITVKEMKERKIAINAERAAKLKTILTAEQITKMEASKKDKTKNHKRKKETEDIDDEMIK